MSSPHKSPLPPADRGGDEIDFLRQTSEGLAESMSRLVALRDLIRRILSSGDRDAVVAALRDAIDQAMRPREFGVMLYQEDFDRYVPAVEGGDSLAPDRDLINWVMSGEKPVTVPRGEDRFVTVVPMTVLRHRVGLLCVDTTDRGEMLNQNDLELLAEIGMAASAAFLNASLIGRVRSQVLLVNNILDSITNGMIVVDNEGCVTRLNRNAMAMLEVGGDVVGASVALALPPEVAGAIDELMRELSESGFAMERMVMKRTEAGTDLPLAVSTATLLDEFGQKAGVIFIFRDMTASRELDRMRRIDQMKSEFVANVSHELKTPLTSIRAYTEALIDMADLVGAQYSQGRPEEEAEEIRGMSVQMKEFMQVVIDEADRLLGLINDLLNVARIQAGKLKLNLEMGDPTTLVTEVLKMSKVQSEKHELVVELAEGLPALLMDKEKLKEVAINLISNAIKYSPAGGKVWVRMSEVEKNLRLEVQDQGIGIAPEHLQKVFDQFYRIDNSLTYEVSGTGLGLAIVKAIVDAHGGKVDIQSEVGKGSTFSVMVPIRRERPKGQFDETFVD